MAAMALWSPACQHDSKSPSATAPAAAAKPVADTGPAKAEPYTVIDAWDGPALKCVHNFATKKVVFHATTPTPGYQFTFDGAVTEQGTRKLQFTLLQPAQNAVQAQVMTDTVCEVDEDKVAGDAATLVAIRRMQQDAHYIVAPPYVVAMSRQ
jgi:hypothetical protein